jgi:hypothetical protein
MFATLNQLRLHPNGSKENIVGTGIPYRPAPFEILFATRLRRYMQMSDYDELVAHLARSRSAPFLFVGSGVSRRYLGLETWEGLLRRFAEMTPRPYAYYLTSGDGNLASVASALADAFHELWWTEDRFEESRRLFGDRVTTRESPLKVEVARHVDAAMSGLVRSGPLHSELLSLERVVIDGAITTNYDPLLTTIFPDFKPYIGQEELLFSDTQNVGEIYAIHGSTAKPDSLVLTSNDYMRFRERNPYLAAKLLTIFVEHPIIFLGYSLSDPDVTQILVSVAKVLTTSNLSRLQDQLVFVQWDPDVASPQFSSPVIAVEGFTIPVRSLVVADFQGVFDVLAKVQRKFPARLLRQLKEHVYKLVLTKEPSERMHVQDIEANTNMDEIDVVFGVGVVDQLSDLGYVGLSRRNLLHDVLQIASSLNARRTANEALPAILRQPGNVPIYRYLREAGLLDDQASLLPDADVDQRIAVRVGQGIQAFACSAADRGRAQRALEAVDGNPERLFAEQPLGDALAAVLLLQPEDLSFDSLARFLWSSRDVFENQHFLRTAWAKAVCFYDYHMFGIQRPALR